MARRSTVEPRWLDDMLVIWGMRSVRDKLGFPAICPMFRERVGQPARSYEPTGYCGSDFDQLQAAIDALMPRHKMVIARCFKPWTRLIMEEELQKFGVSERTWVNWLHEAAAIIAADMDLMKAKDRVVPEY
jgi:hypothetical protein